MKLYFLFIHTLLKTIPSEEFLLRFCKLHPPFLATQLSLEQMHQLPHVFEFIPFDSERDR